jgi:hypothetical protein
MPAKKSTRKKITAAARKVAGKVVTAVKAAPGKIKKAVKSAAAATQRPRKVAAKKEAAAPRLKPAVKAAAKPQLSKSRLPESYGTKRLFLVARDPRWLFAHWDFPLAAQRAAARLAADRRLNLRIFQDSPAGKLVTQVAVETDARHWFVPVGRGETCYVAELGYVQKSGDWKSLAVSAAAVTPSETISPDTSLLMATLPPDVPFQKILQNLGAAIAENLPLTQVIRQLRATGRTELPEVGVLPAPQRWTPGQARALTKLAGAKSVRRRIITELASLTAAHILPEAEAPVAAEETKPQAVAPKAAGGAFAESNPTSPTGGWSGTLA